VKTALKNLVKRLLGLETRPYLELLKSKGLTVGENFTMRDGCTIDFSHSWHIEIGNNVTLAPRVQILAHDASTWEFTGYTKVKNVIIGDRVFIGAGSIVMPGVRIGNDVIIGAGSIVTKDIPDNSVYAGNPAKFMMPTDVYIEKEKAKMNTENCFDRNFSEAENVSHENKQQVKDMSQKHGTAYLK
jgi:maltose O-acetyltransferase